VRKLLSSILAVTVLLGSAALCHAQSDVKPLVTASFSGYDKLFANIGVIGGLAGNPDVGKGMEMMLKLMTQGKGLVGLDTKQPWGLVVQTKGEQQFTVCGFVPVTDLKQLMDLAKSMPQFAKAIELKDDVYEIRAGGSPVFVKQKANWALVSDKVENLAQAPSDPLKALGDLPQRYDLAVRASIKGLPKTYREQIAAQLRAGAEVGLQQMPGESEDEYALRLNVAKQAVQQVTTLVNELDDVLLGWTVDAKAKTTYLDLELTAQTGTKLAQQFAEIKPGKTNFAGLLMPGAAVTANTVGMLTDAQVAQAKSGLTSLRASVTKELGNQGLTEVQLKLAKQLFGDMIDVVEKTVDAKKADGAVSLMLDPKAVTILAGASIADGAKLEKTFQRLAEEIKKSGEKAGVTVKDETYQDIHLHTITGPTIASQMVPLVGETTEAVVGIADDKVLLSVGRDAGKTLKKAIDSSKSASDKEVSPLEIRVSVKPIAKFLAEVSEDEQVKAMAAKVAEALDKVGDKDHVTVTTHAIPQGVRLRLEVEQGLLKVLGTSVGPMLGGGMGGGGF
jgi:hypothetical protein